MDGKVIRIPISRLKRELRKWMRYIDNNPHEVLYISRDGDGVFVLMPEHEFERVTSLPREPNKYHSYNQMY